MYTDNVVRVRLLALIVTVVVVVSPMLGVLCQIDCNRLQAIPACHQSTTSSGTTNLRSAQHVCDHNHANDSLGVVTGPDSGRDTLALSQFSVALSTLSWGGVREIHGVPAGMHGPPGIIGRRVSSSIPILRV